MADYRLSAILSVKDGMTAALRRAAKAAGDLTRGVGGVKDSRIRLNVDGLDKLKRLREQTRGMKFSPIRVGLQDNATPKLTQIKSQLSTLSGRAHTIAVNVQTRGGEQLRNLRQNIGEATNGMLMATGAGVMGVAGVGYGIADTVKTYRDFNYQMQRNKALFTTGMEPAEQARIHEQLIETARKYGSTMIYTNAEVGKALEYMALAGWDAQTSMKALPAVLNAAVASGEDLGLVSDIITDDMTAMGYKAGTYVKNGMGQMVEATQHFSDVLLRTTLRSNTNFQQLGYAMKYAAPLANALGYNIEDVAIAMGLMANNGIKADQAGTGLRGIMLRMINEPKKTAAAMEALGLSMFNADGSSKGFMATIMDVRAKLKGKDAESMLDFVEAMTGEEIGQRGEVADFLRQEMAANGGKLSDKSLAKLASQFSGTYALAPFLALMNSTDEDIRKLMTEIYQKSDGTGGEINREMMNTLAGDLKTLQSAWEDFQYELMNGKGASGLRDFLQAAIKDINAFKTALKDGLDIGDLFALVGNMVTQLKDKFLAFDGIGSILAGGVLMVGLKKLLNMGLRVRNALGEIARLGVATAATGRGAITPAASSVGTMNVKAGVVNLTGAVKGAGGVAPATGGGVAGVAGATAQSARNVAQTAALRHQYAQAASVLAWQRAARTGLANDIAAARAAEGRAMAAHAEMTAAARAAGVTNEARPSRWAGARSAAGGAAALAGVFASMDVLSRRSMGAARLDEADAQIAEQRRMLQELQANGAGQEQLAQHVAAIRELETARAEVVRQNTAEQTAAAVGAAGSIAGAAIGAAVGSALGPIGTMIGGMVGGMAGQQVGEAVAPMAAANQQPQREGLNETIIEREVAERTTPEFTFETPQFTTPIDRTGLRQQTFFEAGEPLPPAKPAPQPSASVTDFRRVTDEGVSKIRAIQDDQWRARFDRDTRQHYREQAETARSDQFATNFDALKFYQQKAAEAPEVKPPEFDFGALFDGLFGVKRAAAAELDETQLAQQAAMERGETLPTQPPAQPPEPPDVDATGFIEGLYSQLEGLGEGVGEIFSGLGTSIQEGLTSAFEGAGEAVMTFGTTIQEGLAASFVGVGEIFSGLGEQLSMGLMTAQVAAETSLAGIKASFDSGLLAIQSAWGALPGFFDGVFAGLGGVASAAGSAIYSGLTAVIGGIIGAWQSAAATISGIISSISAMASSVGSMLPSFGGVGGNYSGTSRFEGGFTEVNEHGGELMLLPTGTRIYPHATTVELLRREIQDRLDAQNAFNIGLGEIQTNFDAPDFAPQIGELPIPQFQIPTQETSTTNTTNNNTSSNANITFGDVNITNGMDFEEFMNRLRTLFDSAAANSVQF